MIANVARASTDVCAALRATVADVDDGTGRSSACNAGIRILFVYIVLVVENICKRAVADVSGRNYGMG